MKDECNHMTPRYERWVQLMIENVRSLSIDTSTVFDETLSLSLHMVFLCFCLLDCGKFWVRDLVITASIKFNCVPNQVRVENPTIWINNEKRRHPWKSNSCAWPVQKWTTNHRTKLGDIYPTFDSTQCTKSVLLTEGNMRYYQINKCACLWFLNCPSHLAEVKQLGINCFRRHF